MIGRNKSFGGPLYRFGWIIVEHMVGYVVGFNVGNIVKGNMGGYIVFKNLARAHWVPP